ncbi:MAG TPA: ribonuclease HII [Cryomorphaceae bacterium]|nr:ribonuclease HII [Cryomorphaceae bacterium]
MSLLKAYFSTKGVEAGCDEAGRGCLAGPVTAAAVVLPRGWDHELLNDSKKISETSREILRTAIERDFEHWAVGVVSPEEIDEINILNASFLAMHRALEQLRSSPELILVDGNRFNPYRNVKHQCVIQGDGIYRSIAAASILAKTHRDAFMKRIHRDYPQYGWEKNKGYPTKMHRQAIAEFGTTPFHRKSFTLLPR